MYTLEQIYDRLTSQGNATKMTTFTEPASGPGSTLHTLDDIYDLAWPARVPKTGQTKCYTNTANSEVNCPAAGWPGQDGDHQKGVAWPNPRFTANVDNNGDGDCTDPGETCDGTVTDNLTGLIWLKDANCIMTQYPGFDADGKVTWQQALQFVAGIDAGTYPNCGAGQTDWRLPNVRELQSLIHHGVYGPAVPNTAGTGKWVEGDPFTGVQLDFYWSSTSAFISSQAGLVNLNFGIGFSDTKESDYYVWPVRGGE